MNFVVRKSLTLFYTVIVADVFTSPKYIVNCDQTTDNIFVVINSSHISSL